MKKFILLIVTALTLLFLTSATKNLPQQFEEFVDRIDKESSSYTEEDWGKVDEQFDALVESYRAEYDNLSSADRESIIKSIGRYRAIVVKSDVSKASVRLHEILGGIGSFLEEMVKSDPPKTEV